MENILDKNQDNCIIAEFMGWEKNDQGLWFGCSRGVHYGLTFHSSWDELMPVVEKIAKDFGYDTVITINAMSDNKCKIGTTTQTYIETDGSWCLEIVHATVVKFIKWHNEQKH